MTLVAQPTQVALVVCPASTERDDVVDLARRPLPTEDADRVSGQNPRGQSISPPPLIVMPRPGPSPSLLLDGPDADRSIGCWLGRHRYSASSYRAKQAICRNPTIPVAIVIVNSNTYS